MPAPILLTLFIYFASPNPHGMLGVADELLLYCLPVVIAIVVLAIAAQRSYDKEHPERTRRRDKPSTKE